MSPFLPTSAVVWAEWGPLPMPLERAGARHAYLLAARRAARIVAVSAGTERSLRGAGIAEGKLTVIPNIVDGERIAFDAAALLR